MQWRSFRFFFPVAAIVAACSSAGEVAGGSSSSGGAGGTSASGSTTASGGTTFSTSSNTTNSTGTGSNSTVSVVAALPLDAKPWGLDLDATHVYWTNSGTGEVMQAKKNGTDLVTLAAGEDTPIAVRASEGSVYWVSYSTTGVLRKVPVGGGTATDMFPVPAARDLVVGANAIWWTREPDDIESIPRNGLPDGGTSLLLTNNTLAQGITADTTSIYFANRLDGYVKKADLTLGNEATLAIGDVPWSITVDGSWVFWTEQGSTPHTGRVMKASKVDGSNPTPLAEDQEGPLGLAVDADYVYWANQNGGTINKVAIAGGPVVVLAPAQEPINVAVDANSVYWTDYGSDAVMKVAK